MPFLFQALFRPSRHNKPSHQARHTWPRLRRSRSTVVPNQSEPIYNAANDPEWDMTEHKERIISTVGTADTLPDDDTPPVQTQPEEQTSTSSESAHKSGTSSEATRSPHGSKRLKNFVARLRGSRSQDQSSVLSLKDALQQTGPDDTEDSQVTTDPVKRDVNPQNAPVVDLEVPEPNRNVSAQTDCSRESKDTAMTVRRHPSQRVPMPLQEPSASWLASMMNFSSESEHALEPSDPFSDGKALEMPRPIHPFSKYGEKQEKRESEASQEQSSKSHSSRRHVSTSSDISAGSQASRGSRLSRLDPSKATMAFNVLAAKLNLPLVILANDATTAECRSVHPFCS